MKLAGIDVMNELFEKAVEVLRSLDEEDGGEPRDMVQDAYNLSLGMGMVLLLAGSQAKTLERREAIVGLIKSISTNMDNMIPAMMNMSSEKNRGLNS